MALVRATADHVAAWSPVESLVELMSEQMLFRHSRHPAPSEQRSWARSLPALARELCVAGLGSAELLLEHQLPLTSRRVDAIVAGMHPRTRRPSYVIIELKQWSSAHPVGDDAHLVTVEGYGGHPVLHPGLQVSGYCEYLTDFTPVLNDVEAHVAGVAYLHNAGEIGVRGLRRLAPTATSQVVSGDRREELHHLLRSAIDPSTPGTAAAELLLNARSGPSRQLLTVAADEIRQREQFVLLDEQRLAYQLVLHAVADARAADTKTVIVVSGGPGSGKSVIALSLLGELARQGRSVLHATGSRSFTKTLRSVAGHRSRRTQALFKYFNSFMDAEKNSLDVLIMDEAHRIRETSVNRWTRSDRRTDRPQIDELIGCARVPVFLLDENQTVRPGELGSVAEITEYSGARGIPVHHIELADQFRCGGSDAYLTWVLSLLGLRPGAPSAWGGDDRFSLSVAASPEHMESILRLKSSAGYSARITAGYCWPWSDPRPDGSLVPDVQVGSWRRPWNLKGDRSTGGAPPAALWATDPAGFDQIGCVYTAQGFEYDWSGVIIGPDLVWRGDRWIAQRSASKDPDFRSPTRVPHEEFDCLIRNVYKVLLTRGMAGTIIFSTDAETQDLLTTLAAGRN